MLELVTLRARPELRPQLFSERLQAVWPEFMQHDPTADLYFDKPHLDEYLDTAFAIVDPADPTSLSGGHLPCPSCSGNCPSGWSCRTPAGMA